MAQIVQQIPAQRHFGGTSTGQYQNVAEQITDLLAHNKGMELENVIAIPVSKIGAVEYEYLVVLTDAE